ncbi:MAG: glutaminase A [Planctomycetota bacterium]|jgi:glutaminase
MNPRLSTSETRERTLFESLLEPGADTVAPEDLLAAWRRAGLRDDDPRLVESLGILDERRRRDDGGLDEEDFRRIIRPGALLIERVLGGQMVIPDFPGFAETLRGIFDSTASNTDGAIADYIPQLARVDPEQYGASVCTTDGQRVSFGDATTRFSSQCTHKPINYCLALEEHGERVVHGHMGCEPSGQSFNEITLNKDGRPHNPMLNAGAIMCAALLRPGLDVADKLDFVIDTWRRLAGGVRPGFDITTYLSERGTADRNFALGYFMREHGALPEGADLIKALEFYTQCCSLEVTTEIVSAVAATLAAGGLCPLTGERVLSADAVQKSLSFMYSCGMYDFSGEWAFRIGLPAKSGVSGVIMVVVPNVLGLSVWSPRLDEHGNSVRGIEFCRELVSTFRFHNYDNLVGNGHGKEDPRRRPQEVARSLQVDLCWAASEGDLAGVRRLLVQGADLDHADYDGRTALHLAAAEGRADVVAFLVEQGVNPAPVDRWAGTPIDDARRGGHERVLRVLEDAVAPAQRRDESEAA